MSQTTLPSTLGGCIFAESPDRSGSEAIIAWGEGLDPACAQITVRRCNEWQGGFQIDRFADRAAVIVTAAGREHVTINNGQSCWRFDVMTGSILNGPVHLDVVIDDLVMADRKLTTVQRLIALHNNPASLMRRKRPIKNNLRIVTALRVSDALNSGASYRQIGVSLFGETRVKHQWYGASESMRSQVRRLVVLARNLGDGGWQRLLL
jgi:hypothetical protein